MNFGLCDEAKSQEEKGDQGNKKYIRFKRISFYMNTNIHRSCISIIYSQSCEIDCAARFPNLSTFADDKYQNMQQATDKTI